MNDVLEDPIKFLRSLADGFDGLECHGVPPGNRTLHMTDAGAREIAKKLRAAAQRLEDSSEDRRLG